MSTADSVQGELRLGTQGWNYPAWTGPFYPEGTRAADFLSTYSRAFDTVEVDSTFYAIPPASTVRGWRSRTPEHFRFALKLPQEITHERRFVDARALLDEFTDRARELESRLGPILIQCGPDFTPAERSSLEQFLPLLPSDIQFAIEFRHRGWITKDILATLRVHQVALTLSDGRWIPRKWLLELCKRPTASFAYLRWMGPDRSITDFSRIQMDRSSELDAWSPAIRMIHQRVRTVYGYANNHFAGHSPATVRMLQQRLGLQLTDPRLIGEQVSLF